MAPGCVVLVNCLLYKSDLTKMVRLSCELLFNNVIYPFTICLSLLPENICSIYGKGTKCNSLGSFMVYFVYGPHIYIKGFTVRRSFSSLGNFSLLCLIYLLYLLTTLLQSSTNCLCFAIHFALGRAFIWLYSICAPGGKHG